MLWIILGDYGAGKTLKLVLTAVSSDREVWGNFTLRWDNYRKIDPFDLKELDCDKIVVLDEMQTWIESRVSMSFQNRFITNIIDQADKRDVDIYGTTHTFTSLDIRFRDNAHRLITCERIGKEPKGRSRLNDKRDYRFKTMNIYSGKTTTQKLRYSRAEKYFELYDTREIIQYPNQNDFELDLMLAQNPSKAYERLMEISREIIDNNGSEVTHQSVSLTLLKNGYSAKHERLVYSCIKEIKKLEN